MRVDRCIYLRDGNHPYQAKPGGRDNRATRSFTNLADAQLWRDEYELRLKRARGLTTLTGQKNPTAAAYSHLRKAAQAIEEAKRDLSGSAHRALESAQDRIYAAEDLVIDVSRGRA